MATDWHLLWVKTSPALQNIEATVLYPGLCFFEATNISVGRGTPYSFEWIGAKWFNLPAINMVCQNILAKDFKIVENKIYDKNKKNEVINKNVNLS